MSDVETSRVFMRLGVVTMTAMQHAVPVEDFWAELKARGYPQWVIPLEFARQWTQTIGDRLVAAGVVAPDEDPLDTILSEAKR